MYYVKPHQTYIKICFFHSLELLGTFIWTPVTAIYLNVFAENDNRDRCFLPIFRVVTGVQLPTAVNTARRGVRTPRILMAGHGGPLFYTIYMYNVDDENRWPRWSLAGYHRESSRSVIAIREGHDHQGQRVFGRGVRPRVDNSDHRGQRVYEGSALAVLYILKILRYVSNNIHRQLPTMLWALNALERSFLLLNRYCFDYSTFFIPKVSRTCKYSELANTYIEKENTILSS